MSDQVLQQILNELQKLNDQVSNMESSLKSLKEDMAVVKQAVLETAEKVDKQEASLAALALRSIEHESAINKLRQAK
ncbi:hypothetical protein [Thermoflavimicrobium dichotomicum]|uniref:Uncharacterized protein n=1 Tax=Thermoflavimicrobium dichotomicum TaxID=46223 RepID=A0A1I3PCI8_9BACL|nr:hypothetical protein [Thermoflavimicrobium dichotomicum]SFJ18756.1 hypothetical protein SAMN05421852_105164 [Thermoflavimicrobium dichotomicum]